VNSAQYEATLNYKKYRSATLKVGKKYINM